MTTHELDLHTHPDIAPLDLDEEIRKNVLATSVDGILNWARSSSLWPAMFGLACCEIMRNRRCP